MPDVTAICTTESQNKLLISVWHNEQVFECDVIGQKCNLIYKSDEEWNVSNLRLLPRKEGAILLLMEGVGGLYANDIIKKCIRYIFNILI